MSTPEDIMFSSLSSLYSHTPITFSSPGVPFTHAPSGITLASPDPAASNWNLHASSLWVGSLFLANHLNEIALRSSSVHVLELGAATGLPGILFAKRHPKQASVTLSDYPDDNILCTLKENIERNGLSLDHVRVIGHAWGTDTVALGVFDIVLAADTLWNPEMHTAFCATLCRVLRRSDAARAYLVVGLHTGRWVIHSFLKRLAEFGLKTERTTERMVQNDIDTATIHASLHTRERDWSPERNGEDENEQKKWIVWIAVKWTQKQLSGKLK